MSSIYETLSKINVNDNTEKKGRFTYLSWAWAWAELMKAYPTATRTVYENAEGLPCFIGLGSVIVKVGVTINGIEHIQHHPVFDSRNTAIPANKANLMDVNTAIQRATVKAIGLHGLGLYIYAGEDVPQDEAAPVRRPVRQPTPPPPTQHVPSIGQPAATEVQEAVDATWKGVPEFVRKHLDAREAEQPVIMILRDDEKRWLDQRKMPSQWRAAVWLIQNSYGMSQLREHWKISRKTAEDLEASQIPF